MTDNCKHNWVHIETRTESIANQTTSTFTETIQFAYFTCHRCRKTEKRKVENATPNPIGTNHDR